MKKMDFQIKSIRILRPEIQKGSELDRKIIASNVVRNVAQIEINNLNN